MNWSVIIAIVLGPILAVQIQAFIENKKEKKARKMQIFRILMATRATPLFPQHVEALNMIDIEFYKDKEVVKARKLLLDNFENYPKDTKASDYQMKLNACAEKSKDLLTQLLYKMANSLNYSFDKVYLERGAYNPMGHTVQGLEQEVIRRGLAAVFGMRKPLPIKVVNVKEPEQKTTEKKETIPPNSIPPQN